MNQKYFYDTYALVEIEKGNKKFAKYSDDSVTLAELNLIELTYTVLRLFGEDAAQRVYKKYKEAVIQTDENLIVAALKFRYQHHKNKYSYADAIGYTYALKHNLIFLTGDGSLEIYRT